MPTHIYSRLFIYCYRICHSTHNDTSTTPLLFTLCDDMLYVENKCDSVFVLDLRRFCCKLNTSVETGLGLEYSMRTIARLMRGGSIHLIWTKWVTVIPELGTMIGISFRICFTIMCNMSILKKDHVCFM